MAPRDRSRREPGLPGAQRREDGIGSRSADLRLEVAGTVGEPSRGSRGGTTSERAAQHLSGVGGAEPRPILVQPRASFMATGGRPLSECMRQLAPRADGFAH